VTPNTWFSSDPSVDLYGSVVDSYFQSSPSSSGEFTITNTGIISSARAYMTNEYGANYHRPDYSTIMATISGALPQHSLLITNFLENHFQNTKARVTGLRARAVNYFPGQVKPWPVVEWREDQDTDISLIFDIENQELPCSYLMHTGVGLGWHGEGRRWRKSSFMWFVAEVHQLKELFVAAQQILGVLQSWSDTDTLNLHHENSTSRDGTQNALGEFGKLFMSHILRRDLNMAFDTLSPLLEKLGSKIAVSGMDGQQYSMICACLEL